MTLVSAIYVVFLAVALVKREALASSNGADVKIVNGTVVPFGDAPFQVSLQENGIHHCGGSIIDPNFIVTAAHCCRSSGSFYIAAGLNRLSNPEAGYQNITVAGITVHPHFDPHAPVLGSDICILKLKETLILSSERRTAMIKLPPAGYSASGMANVTGWGESFGTRTDALMRVTVTIVPDDICRQSYPNIVDEMICAGEDSKGSCYGDSGGPLVDSDGFLVGIVSFGPSGCVVAGYPGGYTEVSYFNQWITATMDGEGSVS